MDSSLWPSKARNGFGASKKDKLGATSTMVFKIHDAETERRFRISTIAVKEHMRRVSCSGATISSTVRHLTESKMFKAYKNVQIFTRPKKLNVATSLSKVEHAGLLIAVPRSGALHRGSDGCREVVTYFAFELHVIRDVLDIAGNCFDITSEKIIGELTCAVCQRPNLSHQISLS